MEEMNTQEVMETIEPELVEEAPAEKPKKTRKPRQKVRPIEELIDARIGGMSDKEKEVLINFLKDNLREAINKSEMLDNNIIATREQAQEVNRQFEQMEAFYREKLQYVNLQVKAFSESINAAILGGAK